MNETLENIIEDMQFCVDARRCDMRKDGGMSVPYHGPLHNAQPSVLKDIERWIARLSKVQENNEIKADALRGDEREL